MAGAGKFDTVRVRFVPKAKIFFQLVIRRSVRDTFRISRSRLVEELCVNSLATEMQAMMEADSSLLLLEPNRQDNYLDSCTAEVCL